MKNKIKFEVAKAAMMIRRFPVMIMDPIFLPNWRFCHHRRQCRPTKPPSERNWGFFVAVETEETWIKFSIVFFQTLLNYFFRIATLAGIYGPCCLSKRVTNSNRRSLSFTPEPSCLSGGCIKVY